MVKRDELLKDLKDAFMIEEELVGKLAEFYQVLGWRAGGM